MKRKMAILTSVVALALLVITAFPPSALATVSYLDIDGAYTVMGIQAKYLDGTTHVALPRSTLIINNTSAAVTASLTGICADIALTGILGGGSNPFLSLSGTDSVGTNVSINGKIVKRGSTITGISCKITGYITSEGKHGTDSGGTSASAYYVGANSRGGEGYSTLLTKGTGNASSTYVLFDNINTGLKVKNLASMPAGYGFYYYLSAVPGPQMELHFESSNGIGWVDITVMPAQGQWGHASAWTHVALTSSLISTIYYGEDSIDGTAFDFAEGGKTLGEMLALINAEAVMTGCKADNWALTRIRFELWEAGSRTCYIDDVSIGGKVYTFEPMYFDGAVKAFKQ